MQNVYSIGTNSTLCYVATIISIATILNVVNTLLCELSIFIQSFLSGGVECKAYSDDRPEFSGVSGASIRMSLKREVIAPQTYETNSAYYNFSIMPSENELFSQLARAILEATERFCSGDCLEDEMPTASELARRYNYRLETVKKKLRVLKEQGLIQPISMTPKRYRFNQWALKSLDEDHPFHALFCEPESPYYIEYHHH
jgi:hypothetical protein